MSALKLFWFGIGGSHGCEFQITSNCPLPPITDVDIVPSFNPLQVMFVTEALAVIIAGSLIVIDELSIHPQSLSVTITE